MASRIAGQGSHWIRPDKRLAIYLRDGMACAYCGAAPEGLTKRSGVLSLDHLIPVSAGGDNEAGNLVTCCRACNSERGAMPLDEWLQQIHGDDAGYTARWIVAHIAMSLKPFRVQAKEILARQNAAALRAKVADGGRKPCPHAPTPTPPKKARKPRKDRG